MGSSFDGRVVVVTGAGTGIGAAIARGFGRLGATVAVHFRSSAEDAEQVARDIEGGGGKALLVQADLTDLPAAGTLIDAVCAEAGGVDVLVNNAGGLVRRALVPEADDALYEEVMALNFGSVFAACRAVVPVMRARGGGAIVNLSSVAARNGGGRGAALYCAGKGAVNAFTRALAKEVAPDGIRVNAISPGIIDTAFHRLTAPQAFDAMVATIPLGRAAGPEEVVGAAVFLADATQSSFVTGHVLEVNGGQVLG